MRINHYVFYHDIIDVCSKVMDEYICFALASETVITAFSMAFVAEVYVCYDRSRINVNSPSKNGVINLARKLFTHNTSVRLATFI